MTLCAPRIFPSCGTRFAKRSRTFVTACRQVSRGPFFNDEFGTTFGNIYALTGEGFDYAVLKDYADRVQLQLQRVKDVGKVELIGLQDEKTGSSCPIPRRQPWACRCLWCSRPCNSRTP